MSTRGGHRARVTADEIRRRLADRPIELVEYGGSMLSLDSRWRCLADGCGHEWTTTASNVTGAMQSGCAVCFRRRRGVTVADIRERLGDRPIVLVEYGGAVSHPTRWRCLVDGCRHEWTATATSVTGAKQSGCPACARRRTRKRPPPRRAARAQRRTVALPAGNRFRHHETLKQRHGRTVSAPTPPPAVKRAKPSPRPRPDLTWTPPPTMPEVDAPPLRVGRDILLPFGITNPTALARLARWLRGGPEAVTGGR